MQHVIKKFNRSLKTDPYWQDHVKPRVCAISDEVPACKILVSGVPISPSPNRKYYFVTIANQVPEITTEIKEKTEIPGNYNNILCCLNTGGESAIWAIRFKWTL